MELCNGARLRHRLRLKHRHRLRLRLGGGVGRSVLVATPDSVHSTFFELVFLMPQHHIHIPPRALLYRRHKPTQKKLKGRLATMLRLRLRIRNRLRPSLRMGRLNWLSNNQP